MNHNFVSSSKSSAPVYGQLLSDSIEYLQNHFFPSSFYYYFSQCRQMTLATHTTSKDSSSPQ
jgi:hypothetical protein